MVFHRVHVALEKDAYNYVCLRMFVLAQDEATAAAEAMAMSQTITKNKKVKFFVSDLCNPQTIAVCQTRGQQRL